MITTFEGIFILRNVSKDSLARILRRTTGYVFNVNGFFRQLTYLGLQKTPYKMTKNGEVFREANYFYSEFHIPRSEILPLRGEFKRDTDIIKFNIITRRKDEEKPPIIYENCTFEEEMRPVPYRPQVEELVEKAKAIDKHKNKRKFKLNIDCDFYPFQR